MQNRSVYFYIVLVLMAAITVYSDYLDRNYELHFRMIVPGLIFLFLEITGLGLCFYHAISKEWTKAGMGFIVLLISILWVYWAI